MPLKAWRRQVATHLLVFLSAIRGGSSLYRALNMALLACPESVQHVLSSRVAGAHNKMPPIGPKSTRRLSAWGTGSWNVNESSCKLWSQRNTPTRCTGRPPHPRLNFSCTIIYTMLVGVKNCFKCSQKHCPLWIFLPFFSFPVFSHPLMANSMPCT